MYESAYNDTKPAGQHRDEFKYAVKKIEIKRKPETNRLGYIGHVRAGQGIELIFDALVEARELKLDMIGHGQALDYYKKLAQTKKIAERITFYGFVKEEAQMKHIISRWEMGLAVYDPSPTNLTYYTEPSKVKMYLQHKLPIIMTKITYISKELEEFHAGVTVDYNKQSLINGIKEIQKNYTYIADGIELLRDKYEFFRYYDSHLRFLNNI